jgi:hypothetical protein
MGGEYSTHGKVRNAYTFFVRKPTWKRPLGRHRHRWEYNNKMDVIRKIGANVLTGRICFRIGASGGVL